MQFELHEWNDGRCNSMEWIRDLVCWHIFLSPGLGHLLSSAFILWTNRDYRLLRETVSIWIHIELTTDAMASKSIKAYFSFIGLSSTLFAVFFFTKARMKRKKEKKSIEIRIRKSKHIPNSSTLVWTKCISHPNEIRVSHSEHKSSKLHVIDPHSFSVFGHIPENNPAGSQKP